MPPPWISRLAAVAPTRWSWVRLVAAPTSWMLLLACVLTVRAKVGAIRQLPDVEAWPLRALAAIARDLVFCGGLAVAFAWIERRSRLLLALTLPVSTSVLMLAFINGTYLATSGEQVSWAALQVGLERIEDVLRMSSASGLVSPSRVNGLALALLLPLGAVWLLRRRGPSATRRDVAADRARAAAALGTVGLVLTGASLVARPYAVERLDANAVVSTYLDALRGDAGWRPAARFAGYVPTDMLDEAGRAALTHGPRHNVLLVVLESTGRALTSLAEPPGAADTPRLAALAAGGLEVTTTRSVITHTTKSLWSMLCGRLPLMQRQLHELRDGIELECLPRALAAAGWRTLFAQSADGGFEDRPRLIARLGFGEFRARQDFRTPLLGYVGADDAVLAQPVLEWIDAAGATPWFATVLTSATHHPYKLAPRVHDLAVAAGHPIESPRDRHARAAEAADAMLGELLDGLTARGLRDSTVVMVVGDHGEGFGEQPIRLHATNYFEEGLRVPWVISGPGVAPGRLATPASLVDVAPTLLALLGAAPSAAASAASPGRDVRTAAPDRALPFGCFLASSCRGVVVGDTKLVFLPDELRRVAFDLARDPHERRPRALTVPERAALAGAEALLDGHTVDAWPRPYSEALGFPRWPCPARDDCTFR